MKAARPEFSLSGLLHVLAGDTPKGAVGLKSLLATPHMLALGLLLVTAYLALLVRPPDARSATARHLLAVALLGMLLHMQFAQVGWFYRYEGYLLLLGLLAVALALRHGAAAMPVAWRGAWLLLGLLGLLALVPCASRSWQASKA